MEQNRAPRSIRSVSDFNDNRGLCLCGTGVVDHVEEDHALISMTTEVCTSVERGTPRLLVAHPLAISMTTEVCASVELGGRKGLLGCCRSFNDNRGLCLCGTASQIIDQKSLNVSCPSSFFANPPAATNPARFSKIATCRQTARCRIPPPSRRTPALRPSPGTPLPHVRTAAPPPAP